MRVVKPTKDNVMKSLLKCDAPHLYVVDRLTDLAEEYVYKMYQIELNSDFLGPGEDIYMNLATSPGSELKRLGFKTKNDAIRYGSQYLDWMEIDRVPVFDYNPKIEPLPLEDIQNGKIRGTFNPQLRYLLLQKFFFEKQNLAITESYQSGWIKCGFVKEYGGFDRLAKHMEQWEYVMVDDVERWDRRVSLYGVYKIRKRGLRLAKDFELSLSYAIFYVLNAYVYCPDGVIRRRLTGNSSGSNNTTHDNSLAHSIIKMRMYIKVWIYARGVNPSLSEILTHFSPAIYADDIIEGLNLTAVGVTLAEYNQIKYETYLEFGLTLHQSLYAVRGPFGRLTPNLTFLGSSFGFDDEFRCYIPIANYEKISSSLIFLEEVNPPITDVVDRVFALTLLSCTNKDYFRICLAFLRHLFKTHKIIPIEMYERLLNLDNPRSWMLHLIGREGGWMAGFKTLQNVEVKQERSSSQSYGQTRHKHSL
jgi:hypothetical protein